MIFVTPSGTVGMSYIGRTAAQLAAAPTDTDKAFGASTSFYDTASPQLLWRMNLAMTAFVQSGTPTVYNGSWSGRPSASANTGSRAIITGLPAGGQTWFYSDGTNWKPEGNRMVLACASGDHTTPAAFIVPNGSAALMPSPASGILIPANLIIPRKTFLNIYSLWEKVGSDGCALTCCVGTSNSFASEQLGFGAFLGSNSALANWQCGFGSSSSMSTQGTTIIYGGNTPGANSNFYNAAINTSADMYINFGSNSTTATAGQSLKLINFTVELIFQ